MRSCLPEPTKCPTLLVLFPFLKGGKQKDNYIMILLQSYKKKYSQFPLILKHLCCQHTQKSIQI